MKRCWRLKASKYQELGSDFADNLAGGSKPALLHASEQHTCFGGTLAQRLAVFAGLGLHVPPYNTRGVQHLGVEKHDTNAPT